ncbi:IclR family transcriptional regulator [Roseinatronobacter alkalisoli]|uniref:IclR family transcriptional regulator n=1 Tax=Roseinatronobacter alkalisoli TaxID=3028235 RepID=A0ABT5T759_9RHOB|nr:IclR family transcriptional regulator [Roseinatronobacter sp. HJB301]MDD7970884.1 IclR family transcriptional regulator [Roseinatronobacter sp. HJB301]
MPTTGTEGAAAQKYTAPALEKGLDILELLSTEDAGLMQTDIARQLNRSVSEIFRMLVVLQARGYVAQNPETDRYMLTTRLFEIAHRTPLIKRLTALSGPVMQGLARDVNQSVHLVVISGDVVLVVGQVDSPGNNIMSVRLGARIEMWRASSGRVIMAHLPEEALTDALARVPLPAELNEATLRRDLARIRETGHEVRDSFIVRGVVNISAPVIDHTGWAIAAMTVPYIERFQDTVTFEECRAALLRATTMLTRNLGGGIARDTGQGLPDDPDTALDHRD